jgi:3-hydroxyisobutyrate dehydrogenase-like beta-hydroxyacid dehydrogenase
VAGKPEAIERCRPVIEAYTGKIIVTGDDPATASSLKLVMNFIAVSLLDLMGQALVFADKRGLNLELVSGFPSPKSHPRRMWRDTLLSLQREESELDQELF